VKAETSCSIVRPELSAWLDEELDGSTRVSVEEHLRDCRECSELLGQLERTRRVLRARPAEPVPDLSVKIDERIRRVRTGRTPEWKALARIAAVAAVIAAVVVATSWPRENRQSTIALAGEVSAELQDAARVLDSYRARYSIVERNNPSGGTRRLDASVTYSAPEKLRLKVVEENPPSGSIPNDFTLVASPRAWSINEVGSHRTAIHRRPFDGTVSVPTDLILPLESLADAAAFEVVSHESVAGYDSYRIRLPYGTAAPLVDALQAGGAWRPFHPTDRVDVWLESGTWFPVAIEVYAGTSRDRTMWASREGLRDDPGDLLLRVQVEEFEQPGTIADRSFRVPQQGIVSDSRFEPLPFDEAEARVPGLDQPDSLAPYRAGTTGNSRVVVAYAGGMSWLKIESKPATGYQSVLAAAPEEIELDQDRWGYYLPASESSSRRVTLFSGNRVIAFEGNLPRAELFEVARSTDIAGRKVPRVLTRPGKTIKRFLGHADPATLGFADPAWLPPGYERSSSYLAVSGNTETLTAIYRRHETELEDMGIRIVQKTGSAGTLLPPSSEGSIALSDGARWLPDEGRLEWISDGVFTSVSVPSRDLSVATRIAAALQ
jgi:hypothetical protein